MKYLNINDFTNSKFATNNKSGCLFEEVPHDYQVVNLENKITTQTIVKDEFAGLTRQYLAFLGAKDKFENYQRVEKLWNQINSRTLSLDYVNSKEFINDTILLLRYIEFYNSKLNKPSYPIMFVKLNNNFVDVEFKLIQGSYKYMPEWYIQVNNVNNEIKQLEASLYELIK